MRMRTTGTRSRLAQVSDRSGGPQGRDPPATHRRAIRVVVEDEKRGNDGGLLGRRRLVAIGRLTKPIRKAGWGGGEDDGLVLVQSGGDGNGDGMVW